MVGILDQKLCGGIVPTARDASSLPRETRDNYVNLLRRAADGDRDALREAREILPGRADRDLGDIQQCRKILDRLNSADRPRIKRQVAKLRKKMTSIEIEIGKLQSQRDEMAHEIARIEDANGEILNPGPLRQRLVISTQNLSVRMALADELQSAGL